MFVGENKAMAMVVMVAMPVRAAASRAILARSVPLQQLQQSLIDVLRLRLLRRLARRFLHHAFGTRSGLHALGVPHPHGPFAPADPPRHSARLLQVLLGVGRLRIDPERGLEGSDALLHFPELHQSTRHQHIERMVCTQRHARCTPLRTSEPTRSLRCSNESLLDTALHEHAPRRALDAARPICGFGSTACAGSPLREGSLGPATSMRTR